MTHKILKQRKKRDPSTIKAANPRTRVFFCKCKLCDSLFVSAKIIKLTCSISCRDQIRSQNGTLKRRVMYKNFIFQSNWEIIIATYFDDNNITWEQPAVRLKWYDTTLNKNRTYLPDFYLPLSGWYIDVKNPFKHQQDMDKLTQIKQLINLFVGDINQVKQFVEPLNGIEPLLSASKAKVRPSAGAISW